MECDLLVLTDPIRAGRDALSVPFRYATVLECDTIELPEIAGTYDVVVIDRDKVDIRWLAGIAGTLERALRPAGRVLVTLGSRGVTSDNADLSKVMLQRLRWQGLESLNGRPCAVLTAGAEVDCPATTADLISIADLAASIDSQHAETGLPPGYTTSMVTAELLERRRLSEHALLRHLEDLTKIAEVHRRCSHPDAGWVLRSLLRRSRAGRLLLRAGRWSRAKLTALRAR